MQAEAYEAKRQVEEDIADEVEESEPEISTASLPLAPPFVAARKRKMASSAPAANKRKLKPSVDPAFELEVDDDGDEEKPLHTIKIGIKTEGMWKFVITFIIRKTWCDWHLWW